MPSMIKSFISDAAQQTFKKQRPVRHKPASSLSRPSTMTLPDFQEYCYRWRHNLANPKDPAPSTAQSQPRVVGTPGEFLFP